MRLDNSDLVTIRDKAKAVWADIHWLGDKENPEVVELMTDTRGIIDAMDKAIKERRTVAISKETDDEMQRFLDGCIGAVEANSFERHALWRLNDEKLDGKKLLWKENSSGLMTCCGMVGGREVWMSLSTAEVGGAKLLFYYASSTFVDHDLVRAWIDQSMPLTARDGIEGGRVNHTDAMNFHNIFPHGWERIYA